MMKNPHCTALIGSGKKLFVYMRFKKNKTKRKQKGEKRKTAFEVKKQTKTNE